MRTWHCIVERTGVLSLSTKKSSPDGHCHVSLTDNDIITDITYDIIIVKSLWQQSTLGRGD